MPKQQEQQRKPLKLLCLTSITMAKLCWLLAIHAIIILTSSETRFCDGSSKKSCKCVHNDACTLYCIGNDICKGSDMTLGCKAGQPCNVICNSDAEENACEDALIDGSLATSLTVTCQDAKSCHGTRVLCGSGDCSVACTSFSGAYSQCENTALSCGSGKCSMQCELGSNTCLGVSINILPTTKSFECTQPGWQNVGCSYIDNYVLPPFSLTTQSPTPATRTPTKSPTHQPSLAPTLRPSLPTASPTLRPSRNPSLYPSGTPSLSPNTAPTPYHYTRTPTDYPTTPAPSSAPIQPTSRFPSSIPTAAPSVHPTIPTYHPTDVPTPAPTKINYYIVGGATNPPTLYSGDGNVYANESPIHERAIGIMSDNWLFTAMAGGVLLCCCFIVCIRCCRRRKQKKLAPQSRRRYVDDEKIGLAVYQNPKHQSVPSKSMMFPRSKSAMFIPPPPNGPPPGDVYGLEMGIDLNRRRAQTEGLSNAVFALPCDTKHATPGSGNSEQVTPAYSELLENNNGVNHDLNPLIDNQEEDDYLDEDVVDNDVLSDEDL